MKIVKVGALRSGELVLDGKSATLNDLAKILAATRGGLEVWYYREDAAMEPTEGQMNVLKAIADEQVPISLSSRPDFSDYIDGDGQSHPRPTK
jgi:hypothetical protein